MRVSVPWVLAAVLLVSHGAWAAEPEPAGAAAPVAGASSDAQFFAELGYKDVALAADVARALVILTSEGAESGADFAAAKTYLKEKGVLPDGWLDKVKPEDPVDKGHLASLICRALGIKGGLVMRLLGPVPRYALAECVYLELMARGADYCHVAGGELVGVIDRADRFRLEQAGRKPPELEGQPSGAAEEAK